MLTLIEKFVPKTESQSVTVCKNEVCRYTVAAQTQEVISQDVANWTSEHFVDVYSDTRDLQLYKNNLWFRVRNGSQYAFKMISCLESDAHYTEVIGNSADLHGFPLNRVIMINLVSRMRLNSDPNNVWVDFVESEDGAGSFVYNCVASIRRSAAVETKEKKELQIESRRCISAAYSAAQEFLPKENNEKQKPHYWPRWEQPKQLMSTYSKEELDVMHATFVAVLEEELNAQP